MKNPSAVKLGRIGGSKKSPKKAVASRQNGKNKDNIRARLTIYAHEEMSDKEFKSFNKWLTTNLPIIAVHKRGELSRVFRATLYKP